MKHSLFAWLLKTRRIVFLTGKIQEWYSDKDDGARDIREIYHPTLLNQIYIFFIKAETLFTR